MRLSIEDIRDLAQLERDMDSGKRSFVVYAGSRMPVDPLVMKELGLVSGQTVNNAIAKAVCEAHIAQLRTIIAERDMKKGTQSHD